VTAFVNVVKERQKEPVYACPCCHHKTLHERGGDEICPVCYWEDDGQDEHDADEIRGGPNENLSLRDAQRNFLEFGACSKRFIDNVRAPLPAERR
jgi:hypothetical protein